MVKKKSRTIRPSTNEHRARYSLPFSPSAT